MHKDTGIIPARAGFTAGRWKGSGLTWDHPRSRGVYKTHDAQHTNSPGSSPLARGLRAPDGAEIGDLGIIPARAGFTTAYLPNCHNGTDHPRSRGVYSEPCVMGAGVAGSSPLARGLQGTLVPKLGWWRIIPARAGFTFPRCSLFLGRKDHPRSRGVYIFS